MSVMEILKSLSFNSLNALVCEPNSHTRIIKVAEAQLYLLYCHDADGGGQLDDGGGIGGFFQFIKKMLMNEKSLSVVSNDTVKNPKLFIFLPSGQTIECSSTGYKQINAINTCEKLMFGKKKILINITRDRRKYNVEQLINILLERGICQIE